MSNQPEERIENKEEQIACAFREAAKDEELNEELELWDNCIGDGLDQLET